MRVAVPFAWFLDRAVELGPHVINELVFARALAPRPAARFDVQSFCFGVTMLVTFRSEATESITMFGDVAQSLLKLMGATGRVPGALTAEDVPAALRKLESEVEALKAATASTPAPPADNEDFAADKNADGESPRPVPLVARAIPLLSLMKRAAAANVGMMWEGK